jgi:hypothetical protein
VTDILASLARSLFPRHLGPKDIAHHYSFTARYRPDQDVELAEHADASVVTVNICLEPDPSNGKVLYFKQHRWHSKPSLLPWNDQGVEGRGSAGPTTFVELSRPGEAVAHLGQIVLGVTPVGGHHSILVVWLFGEHGDVRVAEYDDLLETAEHAKVWSYGTAAPAAERIGEKRDSTADEL